MAFKHGVYTSEVPTSIISPIEGYAGLPVVFGTAPVHLAGTQNINKPVLCTRYSDAVQNFGYDSDWEKYTLCEFMHSHFALYGQTPAVLVNVLDPGRHSRTITETLSFANGKINLGKDIMNVIEAANQDVDDDIDGDTVTEKIVYQPGNDYVTSYDDDNNLILTPITGGALTGKSTAVVTYKKLMPGQVTADDLVGGIDADTDAHKGLECISDVYPKFRLIPGIILAPGWSHNPGVAAVMRAKCENINGLFSAICITDLPETIRTYTAAAEYRNTYGSPSPFEITCWPKVILDGRTYHLSTHIAGVLCRADSDYDDIPVKSPSNEALQVEGTVNADGEYSIDITAANYLNSQGIVTAMNFASGWVAWGNRTSAYPSQTDVKDVFIPVRRMFNYIRNTFITTFWQNIDAPVTRRLIETVINTFNLYLNGLTARGMILGGRIEFNDNENVTTDLLNGILRFHVYITPPVPAEVIEGIFEYDPAYLATLFN